MDTRSALIVAIAIILAAFLHGGVYTLAPAGEGEVYRLNKLNGTVAFCIAGNGRIICAPAAWFNTLQEAAKSAIPN